MGELPELPSPDRAEVNRYSERFDGTFDSSTWFTADQMREYALLAIQQERERIARGAEFWGNKHLLTEFHDFAREIRKG